MNIDWDLLERQLDNLGEMGFLSVQSALERFKKTVRECETSSTDILDIARKDCVNILRDDAETLERNGMQQKAAGLKRGAFLIEETIGSSITKEKPESGDVVAVVWKSAPKNSEKYGIGWHVVTWDNHYNLDNAREYIILRQVRRRKE